MNTAIKLLKHAKQQAKEAAARLQTTKRLYAKAKEENNKARMKALKIQREVREKLLKDALANVKLRLADIQQDETYYQPHTEHCAPCFRSKLFAHFVYGFENHSYNRPR